MPLRTIGILTPHLPLPPPARAASCPLKNMCAQAKIAGLAPTPFSDTKNGVFAILTSKLKGFISVFAVFSILERVCKVYHASENGFFTICQPRKVGFVYSEEGL